MSVASIIARGNGAVGRRSREEHKRSICRKWRAANCSARSALSEPDAGSDLANVSCKATRDGDEWVINGTKTWCTFADGADFIVLFARTSPPTDPQAPPRRDQPVPGAKGARQLSARNHRIADSQDRLLRLEDLGAALRQLPSAGLGAARRGRARHSTAMMAGWRPRACIPPRARSDWRAARWRIRVDVRQAARRSSAIRSAISRRSASSSPRWPTNIEAARQLMYFVANEIDSKRRCDKEASMVKWFASEMAERVTSEALQIHGGYGYTKDFADRALLARRAADQDFRGHLARSSCASSRTGCCRGPKHEHRHFKTDRRKQLLRGF